MNTIKNGNSLVDSAHALLAGGYACGTTMQPPTAYNHITSHCVKNDAAVLARACCPRGTRWSGGSCAAAVVTCEFLVELRATCVLTLQVSQPPSFFLTNATVPGQERSMN